MTQIDVLPAALSAAARVVRDAGHEAQPVAAADLGDSALTGALHSYLDAWSCLPLATAAEHAAQSLEAGARRYVAVESLLVPRSLR